MELVYRAGGIAAGILLTAWLLIELTWLHSPAISKGFAIKHGSNVESWCPVPEPITPIVSSAAASSVVLPRSRHFSGQTWIDRQVKRLSAAVNIPTESYDDNGDVDKDERWTSFNELHKVLKELFPKVHESANLDHVNRYGLVYTLKGTQDDLKPIMLTAHQDVVPATSIGRWKYPPYEAHFDGKMLWGRGSSDCKNNLIGIMSTTEFMLEKGWKPKRTVILAFGFDEETGGLRGAAKIAEHLDDVWGKDTIEMILDEGGMGLTTIGDYSYARPGVAEKGYMDAVLHLETDGGHSSRPPSPHSAIGIMSEMIVALETNPYEPQLRKENPFRGLLECQVKYSPHELEPWLRKALKNNEHDIGKRLAESRGADIRFSMQTSQAVDIIRGGSKVNALPESVEATINYRIAPHDSLNLLKHNIRRYVDPIVRKYSLDLVDFDTKTNITTRLSKFKGTLTLRSLNDLQPAPISPTDLSNPVWATFSGTIRSVFESAESLHGKTVIPVGDIMLGNTDTIQYWNLTRNIYRWSPRREGTSAGVHTIDERMEMEAHLEGMRFYYEIIQNFDRAL